MLAESTVKAIAEYIRIKPEDLQAAVGDEKEVSLEIPKLLVFVSSELEERDKKVHKKGYDDGKIAGEEIIIKSLKEKYNVEADGKDTDSFITAFKAKVIEETKVEPGQKIKDLEGMVATLKKNVEKAETEKQDLENNLRKTSVRTTALNSVQKEYLLSKADMLALMTASGYDIDEENGKVITRRHGDILRDQKTQDPLSFDIVFDEFAIEKGQVKTEPAPNLTGRCGKTTHKPPAVYANITEMQKAWEAEGKSTLGAEFMAKAQEYAKDNPDFFV